METMFWTLSQNEAAFEAIHPVFIFSQVNSTKTLFQDMYQYLSGTKTSLPSKTIDEQEEAANEPETEQTGMLET
jgi:hypothetical protein